MSGEDILVPCKAEDVVPGRNYYMINVMRPTVFYVQEFAPIVEWDKIEMLTKYNRIWRLKEEVPV
jgi:hypothetical protein